MKKALIWCLLMILVAALSIAGALAYLSATDKEANTMTLGKVAIDILEYERKPDSDTEVKDFGTDRMLLPAVLKDGFDYTLGADNIDWGANGVKDGYSSSIWTPNDITNEIDKMVFVKNTGDISAYVRTFFAFEAGNCTTFDQFQSKLHFNLNETDWAWEWDENIYDIGGVRYFIALATYNKALPKGAVTEISLSQIALDSSATSADALSFGEEYGVRVFSQGTQSDGFNDPKVALTKAFGDDIPFRGISEIKTVAVSNVLHGLDGNKAKALTKKVNSITFGNADDYGDAVKGYTGTLTTNVVGAPAYAYYVPNGDLYDVYVLSKDKFYVNKSCEDMFKGMSALTEVVLDNMDFSNVTKMNGMFNGCASLETVDVSDWDVSKVTTMANMFYGCTSLDNLDVSSWNTESLTTIGSMFHNCKSLSSLSLENWDVSNVTNVSSAFFGCTSLSELDFSKWDTSKVTSFFSAFNGCSNLTSLDLSGLETAAVTNMGNMFSGCNSLTSLDISSFNTAAVTNMTYMFSGCANLASLDVSNFNTAKVTDMASMFGGCSALTSLDLSSFNTSKVKKMNSMFAECSKITEIVLGNDWSTAEVTSMHWMLRNCSSLESLDVSGWDVSKVTTMNSMFSGCKSLTELDPSRWNPTNVEITALMFNRCDKIKVFDLSGWNPQSLTNIGQMFLDCYALEKIYVGCEWPVAQITSTNSVFRNSQKLQGGNGTKFSEYGEKGKSFACVDGGIDGTNANAHGYFTYKAAADTNA